MNSESFLETLKAPLKKQKCLQDSNTWLNTPKIIFSAPDTEQDQEIIIETQTPDNQQQQQILQQQEFKRNTPYYNPQQQYNNYLVRYPIWSRFLQPQQQQQLYYGQEYPYGDYYRRYGQYEDIYNQEQQGEYDRAVRDTGSKKDKKNKGGDKQEQQQEKFEQEGYNPYNRVPLYYQQYQRVPYQIYGRDYEQQQQQWPIYQQQVYGNPLLNRWLGYQQYQQYPFYQQQYDLPVYAYWVVGVWDKNGDESFCIIFKAINKKSFS